MKEKSKKNKLNRINKQEISCIYLLPLGMVLAIVPLIVRLKVFPLEGILKNYWVDGINYDFFSYYKSLWIVICTAIGLGVFLYLLIEGKVDVKRTKIYIPMGLYSFFVIISTIFSQHKQIALWGFPDRYEGMFVLLSYMILLFLSINLVRSEKHIKFLLTTLIGSVTVVSFLGLFQFMGYDIFQTNIGKNLILPNEYGYLAPSINFQFEARNAVYSTLFNPNYVGSFMVLVLPLVLALFFQSKKKTKVYIGLLGITIFTNLLGSGSRGGFLGIIFATAVFLFIGAKKIFVRKKYKTLIVSGIVLFVILTITNLASNGLVINRFSSIINFANNNDIHYVETIEIEDSKVAFVINDLKFNMLLEGNQLLFTTDKDEMIEIYLEDDVIKFTDNPYRRYSFRLVDLGEKTVVVFENYNLLFTHNGNEFQMLDENLMPAEIRNDIDQWGFNGQERLGSGRGFIWSRSLPLIKDTILLGYGPDVFAIYFPQDDYIGKLRAYRTTTVLVDKPHNMYLQSALNTGLLSLISIITLFGVYIYSYLKLFSKSDYDTFEKVTGLGILIGILGYLATGIFNDSVVSTAPIFYILLGIGISIIHQLEENPY